ncbi:thioredoxin peroxidase [Pseudothermotoga hypogea DSM 11164 = NBRC 106472]|uniref:Thioredoxin peroxidase n=1 Tax=Pseudothermotoga hypogea DSM 11164 = NBRC 106472 TaxID=1123384 RepID=A0A0X1KSW2_9THEM|nr:thioredoxin peroxidase [Pseudothermotoga hypogea DSM 11164 = NBRC 106472]
MMVGSTAPDFTLKDQDGNLIQLSSLKGRKVLLSFHPLAWTSVCADQMKSLELAYEEFESLKVVPLGISVDPVPSKKAWADALGLKKLRILSDFWPHGEVAKAFGIFRDKDGFSERANVLIDEEGKVIWMKVYPIKQLPDVGEILSFLRSE